MYKFAGNRVLTTVQNRLAGLDLTEWHSGYRAYRVSTLSDLPLDANSDAFDFDTEIILQLHAAGARITEIPIPTHYGDEICYVNGVAYARDIMVHTVRYRLGTRGFGEGQLGWLEGSYGFKLSDNSSHGRILSMMETRPPCRVLDVGCGPGWLADELRKRGHHVVGVDLVEHPDVRRRTDRFVQADLDAGLPDEVLGRLRRDPGRRRARARAGPRAPDPPDDRLPGRHRRGPGQRAQHLPLVLAGPHHPGPVQLRPARASWTAPTCASSPGAASCSWPGAAACSPT